MSIHNRLMLIGLLIVHSVHVFSVDTFIEQVQNKKIAVVPLVSTRDDLKTCLTYLIDREKKDIKLASYYITCSDVVTALLVAQEREVGVEVIADVGCLESCGGEIVRLWQAGVPLSVFASSKGLMHSKYLVFGSQKLVWTGSANITQRGLQKSEENAVVLKGAAVVQEYSRNFVELQKKIKEQPDKSIAIKKHLRGKVALLATLVGGVISLVK